MKIMTVVGTRPEIIKLCCVIKELEKHAKHVLVHTGQNYDYELNEIFFQQLGIRKPDYFLEAGGKTFAETIANVICRSDPVMEKENPDALLLLGDTNSCLSSIVAKRRRIPIFHMEAGNRCFDDRVPEEVNRRIVDHVSDMNLTYSEHARRHLLAEGLRPDRVIKTGSPMKEVLKTYDSKIQSSDILEQLKIRKGGFFLVSFHREENVDCEDTLHDFLKTLRCVAEKYDKPLIVSTHPRTRKRLEKHGIAEVGKQVRFLKPFGFFEYVKMQMNAYCVISDSGTITEESSILGFPAVMVREAHERPEGMDEGTVIMCGLKTEDVVSAIDTVVAQYLENPRGIQIVSDYNVENVSQKVLRIILSYRNYVNRIVWRQ